MKENALKWVGGKHTLAPYIIEKMHFHKFYVEVFAGALNVFLSKPLAEDGSVVNDINKELVNFYKVIRNEHLRNAMIEEIRALPYSRDMFLELKELYKCKFFDVLNPVFRAAVFLYLNATSFNGMFESFSHRERHPYTVQDINEITKMMFNKFHSGNVTIENMHFRDLIKRYDKPGVLFYLDPPYWVTATSKGVKYYEFVMTKEEHTELRDILYKLVHAKWLMSYDDTPEIRELYKDAPYMELTDPTFQSSSSRTAEEAVFKRELLIANYDIKTVNTLFDKS